MIHIRNAHEGETEILTNIGLRAWQKATAAIGDSDVMIQGAKDSFANFTRDSWITITVIEKNGVVCGWAAREKLDENITDFWIDPEVTRQGLGTALLTQIEGDIAAQGFETAALQTHSGNEEAIGFFKAHDYAVHWLSVVYSPSLDRDLPTVGLSKSLLPPDDFTFGSEF